MPAMEEIEALLESGRQASATNGQHQSGGHAGVSRDQRYRGSR